MARPLSGPLLGGRYRLGAQLGKGSQGEIFLAARRQAPRAPRIAEVVVKRLTPRGTWKSFELFEREAKVLSQLRHAGVPRHLATLEEPPGTFNLVMQRVPGENLRDLVEAAPAVARSSCATSSIRCARDPRLPAHAHAAGDPPRHQAVEHRARARRPDRARRFRRRARRRARARAARPWSARSATWRPSSCTARSRPRPISTRSARRSSRSPAASSPRTCRARACAWISRKHLPALDPGFRAALDRDDRDPDPDKRPQRAREVVALLAKAPAGAHRATSESRALAAASPRRGGAAPDVLRRPGAARHAAAHRRARVRRSAAGSAWRAIRLSLDDPIGIVAILAFPARKRLVGVGRELDSMLSEGQGGFTDMMKGAMARRR